MNLTRLKKNPAIAGAGADIQQSEPSSPPPTLADYVIFVDESGDACLDPIDSRSPMLNLVFCIMRKAHYFDHVVPDLKALKEAFFGHTDLILYESEMPARPLAQWSFDQNSHHRPMQIIQTTLLAHKVFPQTG